MAAATTRSSNPRGSSSRSTGSSGAEPTRRADLRSSSRGRRRASSGLSSRGGSHLSNNRSNRSSGGSSPATGSRSSPSGASSHRRTGSSSPAAQYGQPPQQPGQQYDYGQQFPGGAAPAAEQSGGSKKGLWIGIGVLVLAVAVFGITGFVAPGFLKTEVFNNTQMQTDVQKLLTDTYKIEGVTSVTCPAQQEVKDGAKFECTATVNGKPQQVPITVKGTGGNYEVSPPVSK